MRGNEFLDKMELIDPAYVEAADTSPKRQKNALLKWGAMAACLCLVVAGALMIPGIWNTPAPPISDPGTSGIPIPNPDGTIRREEEPEIYPNHPILKPGDEGYIDPGSEPYPEDPYNGFAIGGPFNNQEFLNGKPMISNYGEMSASVDMAVTNGGIHFSQSLQSAMENYGETANYRVLIELFSDGVQISSGSEIALKEAQRLSELNYIVAMETYTETEDHGEYTTAEMTYYFTLHATYEQLRNFPASDSLGYAIMLYDEYFGRNLSYDVGVFNGFAQSDN